MHSPIYLVSTESIQRRVRLAYDQATVEPDISTVTASDTNVTDELIDIRV